MQLLGKMFVIMLMTGCCLKFDQAKAGQTCGDKGTCICTLGLNDIAFRKFNPLLNTPLHITFNLDVTCVLNHKGSVSIDYKIHFAPGHSDNIKYRHMHSTREDILKYNLHQEHEHNLILGDGLGGMIELSRQYTLVHHLFQHNHHRQHRRHHQSPHTDHYTIHAEIPAQPLANIGKYSDQLIVTLIY